MARRHPRHDWERRPRRRVAVFSLAALAVLGSLLWLAPTVLVHTSLRDRPLQAAFAGIDGSIASGGATWNWLESIEYRDVVLRDAAGRAAVVVPLVQLDRGLLRLAVDPHDVGTVRVFNAEAVVEVRRGGSSLEDTLAPWLARIAAPTAAGPDGAGSAAAACDLELVGGTVEFVDLERRDAWRLTDLFVAGTLGGDMLSGWTAAGRLRHAESRDPAAVPPPPPPLTVRPDRGTIPAAATAVLARDGGWSIAAPAAAVDGSRIVTVATHRLPLGASAVVATRFGAGHVVDGLADIRLDVQTGPAVGPEVRGSVSLERLAVCDAATLAERFTIANCDVPLDISVEGTSVLVRRLAATSPVFRAEASGRIGLPTADLAGWIEQLAGDDFSVAVDVDLAAAAHRLPGGIVVRPDVRVTGGTLAFAATARADGGDRLLELRATSRNLEATRSVVAGGIAEPGGGVADRRLAWREPFTAWLRARRGGPRGDRLRIEEARVVSPAVEVSAAATAAGLAVQWNANLGDLVRELAEVLDLGAAVVTGASRGRVEIASLDAATHTVKCSADVSDLEVELPGLPAWRDKEIAIELEAAGGVATGVAAVDRAHGTFTAGGDTLELTLGGGVLVDLARLCGAAGTAGVPWIRPAAAGTGIVAEGTIAGELAGWQPRLAAFVPLVRGVELSGGVAATLAAEAAGDAWQISRAEATFDRLVARLGDHEIGERRVVATATGILHPASGRLDVSAAEVLSATLSLRTGGLNWVPAACSVYPGGFLDGLRGRVQWQADLGRIEGWLAAAATAAAWPVSGRAWGTLEVVETQAGTNMLVEATGSQVALAAGARTLWSEPQMTLAVEVTRPASGATEPVDRITIDRLVVESSTLSVAARGRIDEWSGRRIVDLQGTAAYDWEQLSRLAVPWTAGRARLAGAGSRPFSFRGPLREPEAAAPGGAATAGTAATPPATLPLPEDWLAATRGRDAAATELTARLTRPVAASSPPAPGVEWLRRLAVDTSTAWAVADLDGLPVAAGELSVRLFDGQLALGPFDIAASGGRLRGAPWLRLVPGPPELIVPPGRVVERVALSGELCDRWVKWLSPVLGHSTHTSGVASVDLTGARLPLADPFAGEAAGQVVFENLEVTPTGALEPLINLIAKLQSVADPRFAFGGRAVLMRVRPDPVRVRLSGRRMAHEGLVMDAGQLTVRSAGSVAADGTLAMMVEVALRGDLAGTTPVVGTLLRTPILIPLTGTVQKPQFDARAIDVVVGRIMENTAQAVIVDGLGRGLDALLGGPSPAPAASPPAAPPPLTLPPQ